MKVGDYVRITGGVEANGKIGQLSECPVRFEPLFVGVRIPNIRRAKETVYVTRGSVEVVPLMTIAPGDLVRCLQGDGEKLKTGCIYRVSELFRDGSYCSLVEFAPEVQWQLSRFSKYPNTRVKER